MVLDTTIEGLFPDCLIHLAHLMKKIMVRVTIEREGEKTLCVELFIEIDGDIVKKVTATQVKTAEEIALSN